MSSLVVKTPPAAEPISLAEAKAHLRVDITDEDALIQNYIRAARTTLESTYDVAFVQQSLVLGRDYFPTSYNLGWSPTSGWAYGDTWMSQYDTMELRYGYISLRPPVQSITSVTYLDPATGNPVVWPSSNYMLDADSQPGRLTLALGKTYPPTAPLMGAVKVEFVTGNPTPALVPDDQKQAIKLLCGHMYLNREAVLTGTRLVAILVELGVDYLMDGYAPTLVR